MTLLDIIKLTNTLCGLQGDVDTVASLKDVQVDMLNFVKRSNINIQIKSDEWKFMNSTTTVSLNTVTNTVPSTGVAKWKKVIYAQAELMFVPYDDYLFQDWSAPNVPQRYTVVPETNELILNKLDNTYTILLRYVRDPFELVNDNDVPILPKRFHGIIAYKAAADFGSWLGNAEIEDKNLTEYDTMMLQMQRSEIPSKQANVTPMA